MTLKVVIKEDGTQETYINGVLQKNYTYTPSGTIESYKDSVEKVTNATSSLQIDISQIFPENEWQLYFSPYEIETRLLHYKNLIYDFKNMFTKPLYTRAEIIEKIRGT